MLIQRVIMMHLYNHLHQFLLARQVIEYTNIIIKQTFFVAAIMAMRYNKMAVFLGAGGALVFMTLISCAFGFILP